MVNADAANCFLVVKVPYKNVSKWDFWMPAYQLGLEDVSDPMEARWVRMDFELGRDVLRGLTNLSPLPLKPFLAHYGVDLNEGRWGNEQVCCPVHGERRASMSVNTEKGVAHCFACGFGGDALKLIQAMEGCDRADAQRRAEDILRAGGTTYQSDLAADTAAQGYLAKRGLGPAATRYVPPGRRSSPLAGHEGTPAAWPSRT
jgi:hypothetical protein